MAVFLMGPTGAGKTDLAVELASRLPIEIVSVDSAMVYRGMNIGTGKPDAQVLRTAPHRLVDIRDPVDAYSAASFREDALREIADIRSAGCTPLLVGGTGLYFRALRRGLSALPCADAGLRARLRLEAQASGWAVLHARLARVDPGSAARIHPNDPQRIQRALEVYELTGVPLSEHFDRENKDALELPVRAFVLSPQDRASLHDRIASRFNAMLESGLVEEVIRLRAQPGICRALPSMRAVGYRQVWDYLDGEIDYSAMRSRAVAATRQLARRQLTWLRSEAQAEWLDSTSPSMLAKLLSRLTQVAL